MNKAVTLSAIALAVASANTLATNGYFTHGIGNHNKAQAGAGLAMPSQVIDGANNPAAINLVNHNTELGLSYFAPDRGYQVTPSMANGQGGAFSLQEGSFDSSTSGFLIPYIAHAWRLDNGHAVGLSFYGRGGMNTNYQRGAATFDADGPGPATINTYPGTFGAGDAGVNLVQGFAEATYALSYQQLSLGVAPVVAIQAFEAKGLASFSGYTKTFAQSQGTQMPANLSDNGHDYSYGVGLKLGAIWQATEHLSLALAYQSKIDMSSFDDYQDLFAQGGSFDIPQSVRAGLSVHATNQLALHADVEHVSFSDVDSVGNALSAVGNCPTAGMGGTTIETCAGGDQGFGFGWHDMTTYKLGATWQPAQLAHYTFRAGYSYGEQPVQANDVLINILAPGVIEEHFTAGVERRLTNGNSLSLALMYAPKSSVTGPNLFDPSQQIRLQMSQFEVELAYSF